MASNIFWLVVTVRLLPLITYWLFNPLFSPPRHRTRRLERKTGGVAPRSTSFWSRPSTAHAADSGTM
jgi:hypothetical protein